ncbi:hypothetical protein DERP_013208 [Dermatophagoides pteronyssinus]|uniref:Uncharacterized protein n=1 Tax=Dermatophagoides pteronyssinus TaxID=6956 RepID=A0ABQ8J3L2_DERPT|nr:hypothetical protein DERP_013208 [Dermatophagoides pteronyssinus]
MFSFTKQTFTFHCIGKNSSSKIFYDPNGRCDIRQNQCICSDMKRFRRVQIKMSLAIDSVGSGNRRDLKSDEESILSSSIMKSSINERSSSLNNKSGTSVPNLMNGLNNKANNIGSNQRSQSCRYSSKDSYGNKTTNSVKQARRMSRKRRMKVYSPSAQCKSCRSLLLSVAATSPSSSVSAVAAADHHKDKDLIKDKDNMLYYFFIVFFALIGLLELYDCVVYNTDQYWKSRDSDENIQIKKFRRFRKYRQQFNHDHRFLSMINPLANRLVSIRVWLDSWLQMDRIDRNLFEQHNRMRLFPHSPIKTRNRLLIFIFLILFQFFTYYCRVFTCIAVLYYISTIFIIDIVATLIQCAILLSCSIISSYLIFNGNLNYMNHKLIKLLENIEYNNHQINVKDTKQLKFYLNEHTKLSYFVIYTDKTTWSQALYYYALISIPINITLMCELIVEDLIPETKLLFIAITVMHAVTGSFPFILFADMSNNFHAIKDYLPALQLQLKRSTHLRLKLKYDDLYERLLTGKKIAFTFGTLGELTFRGLFEALLGYIAAFFLILKIYMNEQQINNQQYNNKNKNETKEIETMLFKIKSFLYNTMKHIANEYGSGQYRLLHDPEKYPLFQYDYGAALFLAISFQVLYDCIVFNTDQYWKSMDTEDNIPIKKSDRFQQYRQQFEHDHRFLSMINPLADRLVSLKVWFDSWLQMDRIDRKLFQQHNRMRLFPHSPIEGRNRIF